MDTATPMVSMVFTVMAALAQMELEIKRERITDSVAKIVASLGELNADALDMVEALEGSAAKPRTSLLSAVADERIKRADAALKTDAL